MSDTILQVEGLKKKYIIEKSFFGKEKSSVNAVDDISFSIKKAQKRNKSPTMASLLTETV